MSKPLPPPPETSDLLGQEEIDRLLVLNGFLEEDGVAHRSMLDEIESAILDSGKLSIPQWTTLRTRLREVERLAPHIDLIIALKQKRPGPKHQAH